MLVSVGTTSKTAGLFLLHCTAELPPPFQLLQALCLNEAALVTLHFIKPPPAFLSLQPCATWVEGFLQLKQSVLKVSRTLHFVAQIRALLEQLRSLQLQTDCLYFVSKSCENGVTHGTDANRGFPFIFTFVRAASLLASVLAVSFLFPWQLVSITKYKAKINGPWDEAVPIIPKELRLPLLPNAHVYQHRPTRSFEGECEAD